MRISGYGTVNSVCPVSRLWLNISHQGNVMFHEPLRYWWRSRDFVVPSIAHAPSHPRLTSLSVPVAIALGLSIVCVLGVLGWRRRLFLGPTLLNPGIVFVAVVPRRLGVRRSLDAAMERSLVLSRRRRDSGYKFVSPQKQHEARMRLIALVACLNMNTR
ncbi:hypothetical protein KC344_g167 [Hortaea werneckii]|nr:hypothetical protein KC344_g167 [Hortaea werneckii]